MPAAPPGTEDAVQTPEPFLPDDPLERFLELTRALGAQKRWYQSWNQLRFAASGLVTVPGPPGELVGRLFRTADEIKRRAGWFGPLQSEIRYCVAAALLREGSDPARFQAACERGRSLFRGAGLRRSGAHEVLAILILSAHGEGEVRAEDVRRLASIHAGMRRHHGFLTGPDDYAAAALLATTDGRPEEIIARVERFYDGLRELRFARGNQLQLASHLLYFNPAPHDVALRRFRDLYAAFKAEKLWMREADYDEMAVLSFLEHDTRKVVHEVMAHRARLAGLRPRPQKQERFTLACNTVFLAFAPRDVDGTRIREASRLVLVRSLIHAQQAAAAAAAAGGAAAASAAASG